MSDSLLILSEFKILLRRSLQIQWETMAQRVVQFYLQPSLSVSVHPTINWS